jgi:hypothetical protein
MTDCCATADESAASGLSDVCGQCRERGKPVETQLVKAMLAISLRGVSPSARYHFCSTAGCEIVYFAADHAFTTGQVRERVHQKAPQAEDVPVCYCFGHTPGSMRAEWQATGTSSAVADITAGIQAGQCACEIRNPQGACCLGNVRAVVKAIMREPSHHPDQ